MATVQGWAGRAGFTYRASGDELFSYVPSWVVDKTRDRVQVASDLARLRWIRQLLDEGWSVAVWIDADVFVVDPDRLTEALDLERGYLLGRESWVQHDGRGKLRVHKGVHNALCAFRQENTFLRFYLDAAERIVARHEGVMVPQLIGPKLLTGLDNLVGLPATSAVNIASPLVVNDLAMSGGPALDRFLQASSAPPAALNLCLSHMGKEPRPGDAALDQASLEHAVARLQQEGSQMLEPRSARASRG